MNSILLRCLLLCLADSICCCCCFFGVAIGGEKPIFLRSFFLLEQRWQYGVTDAAAALFRSFSVTRRPRGGYNDAAAISAAAAAVWSGARNRPCDLLLVLVEMVLMWVGSALIVEPFLGGGGGRCVCRQKASTLGGGRIQVQRVMVVTNVVVDIIVIVVESEAENAHRRFARRQHRRVAGPVCGAGRSVRTTNEHTRSPAKVEGGRTEDSEAVDERVQAGAKPSLFFGFIFDIHIIINYK